MSTRILILLILHAAAVFAQPAAQPAAAGPHRYFLAVAVNEPTSEMHFQFTHSDAQSMAAAFERMGYETRALIEKEATATRVRASLREIADKARAGDVVVIYFSGLVGELVPGELFFGVYGTDVKDPTSALSILEVRTTLEVSAAHSLVILDGPGELPKRLTGWDAGQTHISLVVGKGIEKVETAHGEFTFALLRALGTDKADEPWDVLTKPPVSAALYGARVDWALSSGAVKAAPKPTVSRMAIMISTSEYPAAKLSLPEAAEASRRAAERLRAAGFPEVRIHNNLTGEALNKAIADDSAQLLPKAEVVLYVAGMAQAAGNGVSVLSTEAGPAELGRDFPATTRGLSYPPCGSCTINIRRLIDPLMNRGETSVFVVLDTAFSSGSAAANDWLWKWGADAPVAVLLAALPKIRPTVSGGISLFAAHFLAALAKPGLTVQQLAERTQSEFMDDSKRAAGEVPLFASPSGPLFVVNRSQK